MANYRHNRARVTDVAIVYGPRIDSPENAWFDDLSVLRAGVTVNDHPVVWQQQRPDSEQVYRDQGIVWDEVPNSARKNGGITPVPGYEWWALARLSNGNRVAVPFTAQESSEQARAYQSVAVVKSESHWPARSLDRTTRSMPGR